MALAFETSRAPVVSSVLVLAAFLGVAPRESLAREDLWRGPRTVATTLDGEDVLVAFARDDAVDDLGDVQRQRLIGFAQLSNLLLQFLDAVGDRADALVRALLSSRLVLGADGC